MHASKFGNATFKTIVSGKRGVIITVAITIVVDMIETAEITMWVCS